MKKAYCKMQLFTLPVQDILGFEADKQAIILTINSLSTDLSRNDRHIFFPEMGSLYPDGHRDLVSCNDFGQVQTVMEMFASFEGICTRLRRSNDISVEKVWTFFLSSQDRTCRLTCAMFLFIEDFLRGGNEEMSLRLQGTL
tara:strand:- start:2216 stop:2638 length:423 start_codon:yes stop_codon:yes gene_type:complete